MGPKKMTDEQREAAFNDWKAGPEWTACEKFMGHRAKIKLEIALHDICDDFSDYLEEIHALGAVFKVPRKAKQYEQKFVRTMFFIHIKQGDEHEIDGVKYKISMPANVENFNCRSALFEIHQAFEENKLSMDLTPENF